MKRVVLVAVVLLLLASSGCAKGVNSTSQKRELILGPRNSGDRRRGLAAGSGQRPAGGAPKGQPTTLIPQGVTVRSVTVQQDLPCGLQPNLTTPITGPVPRRL